MKHTTAHDIAHVKHFLLDLDGTVYLGDAPIAGAVDFINHLASTGREYTFLTNNSSKSAEEYLLKLQGMGFRCKPSQILTSGQAAGWYIEQKFPASAVYVLGTESLRRELAPYNFSQVDNCAPSADVVLAGFDTELTYDKLRTACRLIASGAAFIATNPDFSCPIGNHQYIPDCGSICFTIEKSTGTTPVFIGKPHTVALDYLREKKIVTTTPIAIVGDRLYTDIALGCNASILSICVLTGESDVNSIRASHYKPDMVVSSVADLISRLT